LAETQRALAHQFDDLAQQHEASNLGMWAFLLTEVMFFGGLFVGYTVYRTAYLPGFIEGSHHLDILIGTLNTAILISSSLTMALAVHAAQEGRPQRLSRFLLLTMLLGLVFLSFKAMSTGISTMKAWYRGSCSAMPGSMPDTCSSS
jgi:cytochrome c oxidase subunit 3